MADNEENNIEIEITPPIKKRESKLTEADVIEMITLRKLGMKDDEIAEIYSVHTQTVVKWFRRLKDRGYEVPDAPMGRPREF